MSKKKTALQYCISVIDEGITGLRDKYQNVDIISIDDKARLDALESFRNVMAGQLPTERQQIEEAHSDSWNRSTENWEETPAEYYESTYETP